MHRKLVLTALVAFVLIAAGVQAQGTGVQFLNFDAPAHEPIAVAEVGGSWLLLVANGPDNSVEVYDTEDHAFLFRIPVGQRPVTVAVKPTKVGGARRIYVANWLGDSITLVELLPGPDFRVRRTMHVGDEPVGIAFLPENPDYELSMPGEALHESLLVTFSAQAGWGWFFEGTIETPPAAMHNELLVNDGSGGHLAVRDPRAIAFAPPPPDPSGPYRDQMWILNFRGGNDPLRYDLDLWGTDDRIAALYSDTANLPAHGGFGTTNFNMAFAPNGHLWVVGTLARNKDPLLLPNEAEDPEGEKVHHDMVTQETGFAISFLKRLKDPAAAAGAGDFLDLNDVNKTGLPGSGVKQQASVPIAQPTDVLVYGSGAEGETRLFVTGFNSDTLAMVLPTDSGPTDWQVVRLDLADPEDPFHPILPGGVPDNLDGVMRGPRALALKSSAGAVGGAGDLLYVYNRLESSITVVDPNFALGDPVSAVIRTFPLRFQVEPAYIVKGRKFLYSSKLSGGGNVSCATCHVDGNSDFLAWNLSDNKPVPSPSAPGAPPGILGPNAAVKGPMVTQPLRGLVNFEVEKDDVQDLYFSNKPYHWRGDRGFFDQFNGAFVNLMGILVPDESEPPKGIPDRFMHEYREAAFSIHYPPNPNQVWTRVYSDTASSEEAPPFAETAPVETETEPVEPVPVEEVVSARRGLELFHTDNTENCVQCHNLPDGSNNLATEAFYYLDTEPDPDHSLIQAPNGLETAQLKGLVLKEKRLLRINTEGVLEAVPPSAAAVTHEFGLVHTGKSTLAGCVPLDPDNPPPPNPLCDPDTEKLQLSELGSLSIPDFVKGFLGMPQATQDSLVLYLRELDSGTGPLVGFSHTVDAALFNSTLDVDKALMDLEKLGVEKAHAGLAVHAWIDGVLRGFYYDTTDAQAPYHEEPQEELGMIGPFDRAGLLSFVADPASTNVLMFHFTPLGSERRVAHLEGGTAPGQSGVAAPTSIELLPCLPMTANAIVPTLTAGWVENIAGFNFLPPTVATQLAAVHFQKSLIHHAAGAQPPGFGLAALHHETPRRFRVKADGIREGAQLILWPPSPEDVGDASSTGPPTSVPDPVSNPNFMRLPLYPARDANGGLVWETAVEIEPFQLLAFMNGGDQNPFVALAQQFPIAFVEFDNTVEPPVPVGYLIEDTDFMEPLNWNWWYVQVINDPRNPATLGTGGWQRLTIE